MTEFPSIDLCSRAPLDPMWHQCFLKNIHWLDVCLGARPVSRGRSSVLKDVNNKLCERSTHKLFLTFYHEIRVQKCSKIICARAASPEDLTTFSNPEDLPEPFRVLFTWQGF